jgi:hypothetical protein
MKKVGNTWLPDGDSFFPAYFEKSDVFEQINLDAALFHVKRWGVAVDGGAHVGSWSRYMASRFQTVVAFEPHPENFACLTANCVPHGVICVPAAIGAERGCIGLESGNNSGCWHAVPGGKLPMIRLPDFGALDFLKLDLEGFEYEALVGCYSQLERYRPVVLIEEKDLPHKRLDYRARKLLEGMGYRQVAASGRDVVFA